MEKPGHLKMTAEAFQALKHKPLRHKFNAQRAERNGIKFPSKAQAAYYDKLILRQKTGALRFFLMEVPFHLPGGVIYKLDFLEFWANDEVVLTDVKGFETPVFRIKQRQVEALYGVEIKLVSPREI